MTSCATTACGTGDWNGPQPGDPDNNSILSATPAFGGIDVSWTYPATNPQAVAYVQLYRGLSSTFANAILLATVGGNFFYDKSTSANLTTYYYWIKIVSVNGTVGELIGPASAIAKPTIASVIEGLTGRIDAGLLAQSLRTDIDRITLNYAELTGEIADRIAGNNALSAALAQVQSGVTESLAFINEEITSRQEGDSALLQQVNVIAAVNATNAAAIITEQTARVTADNALSSSIASINAATNANAAAILTEQTARTNADSALASQITTAQTTLNGNIASVQTSLQTSINTVNGTVTQIGALYTAKVSVNGLIGGFGIYNDGSTIQAGFDVDEFWVGKTQGNKRKPFIISGGVTYIDEAAIEKLTFSKLRDASGSFVVENGKVKADYLNVNRITGGSFTGYAWPAYGQQGFFLGPGGFLMGNANNGKYFQITEDGNIYAPSFNIVNGSATFSGNLSGASGSFSGTLTAQTIVTGNLVGGAVTSGSIVSSSGSSVQITISGVSGGAGVSVQCYVGDPYMVTGGSGENTYSYQTVPIGTLYVGNGPAVTSQAGHLFYAFTGIFDQAYTFTVNRNYSSGTMVLVVTQFKR
jgi:hypothetical protein